MGYLKHLKDQKLSKSSQPNSEAGQSAEATATGKAVDKPPPSVSGKPVKLSGTGGGTSSTRAITKGDTGKAEGLKADRSEKIPTPKPKQSKDTTGSEAVAPTSAKTASKEHSRGISKPAPASLVPVAPLDGPTGQIVAPEEVTASPMVMAARFTPRVEPAAGVQAAEQKLYRRLRSVVVLPTDAKEQLQNPAAPRGNADAGGKGQPNATKSLRSDDDKAHIHSRADSTAVATAAAAPTTTGGDNKRRAGAEPTFTTVAGGKAAAVKPTAAKPSAPKGTATVKAEAPPQAAAAVERSATDEPDASMPTPEALGKLGGREATPGEAAEPPAAADMAPICSTKQVEIATTSHAPDDVKPGSGGVTKGPRPNSRDDIRSAGAVANGAATVAVGDLTRRTAKDAALVEERQRGRGASSRSPAVEPDRGGADGVDNLFADILGDEVSASGSDGDHDSRSRSSSRSRSRSRSHSGSHSRSRSRSLVHEGKRAAIPGARDVHGTRRASTAPLVVGERLANLPHRTGRAAVDLDRESSPVRRRGPIGEESSAFGPPTLADLPHLSRVMGVICLEDLTTPHSVYPRIFEQQVVHSLVDTVAKLRPRGLILDDVDKRVWDDLCLFPDDEAKIAVIQKLTGVQWRDKRLREMGQHVHTVIMRAASAMGVGPRGIDFCGSPPPPMLPPRALLHLRRLSPPPLLRAPMMPPPPLPGRRGGSGLLPPSLMMPPLPLPPGIPPPPLRSHVPRSTSPPLSSTFIERVQEAVRAIGIGGLDVDRVHPACWRPLAELPRDDDVRAALNRLASVHWREVHPSDVSSVTYHTLRKAATALLAGDPQAKSNRKERPIRRDRRDSLPSSGLHSPEDDHGLPEPITNGPPPPMIPHRSRSPAMHHPYISGGYKRERQYVEFEDPRHLHHHPHPPPPFPEHYRGGRYVLDEPPAKRERAHSPMGAILMAPPPPRGGMRGRERGGGDRMRMMDDGRGRFMDDRARLAERPVHSSSRERYPVYERDIRNGRR